MERDSIGLLNGWSFDVCDNWSLEIMCEGLKLCLVST